MQINYHRNKCIGCSACIVISRNIWALNTDDGKADLMDSQQKIDTFTRKIWDDEIQIVKEIERSCPTKAIKIIIKN